MNKSDSICQSVCVSYNQLITYYLPVCYLLRIQQYPVNTTYNTLMTGLAFMSGSLEGFLWVSFIIFPDIYYNLIKNELGLAKPFLQFIQSKM